MDFQTGWDVTKEEDSARGREMVFREQAQLIIGSPPCTAFSTLQNEATWRGQPSKEMKRQQTWTEAACRVDFCVELYKHQLEHGRSFLHEHPLGASSWALPAMQESLQVMQIKADMCRFGMVYEETDGTKRMIKKPTRFVTNPWASRTK